MLRRFRRRRFERFRFAGSDALVARVPDGGAAPRPPEHVDTRSMRIYPVRGGHLFKWEYDRADGPVEGFEVEPGGWDHEHCDACDRTIAVGGIVWLTVRGSFVK